MKIIPGRVRFFIEFYILYRANIIMYLRDKGAKVGANCEFYNDVPNFGSEPWLIEIGNNVTLTRDVYLITHDASSRLFRKDIPGSSPYGNRFGPIRILDNCFIGVNSIILPGVTIGPNSIVGAGSVVSKDVMPNMVVAGAPAREIATLDEYIEKYKSKMIPIKSQDRRSLRRELTEYFWGEER